MTKIEVSKEWCMRMAEQEVGHEIGAGALAPTEYGWVIEHGGSPASSPLYWCGGYEWYADHLLAVRFVREIDATKVRDHINFGVDHGHRVAEHGWG